ncbi:MAG: four helix bundle protein [Paludibacteraceae bacterium]
MAQNFEDLLIWQRSRELVKEVYHLLQDNKDFGFRDQIQRAAISVMNNIAEGFDRNKFTKENTLFIHFLGIAIGSCGEVKSMLYAAEDLGYISSDNCRAMRSCCVDIEIKTRSLITSLRTNSHGAKQS